MAHFFALSGGNKTLRMHRPSSRAVTSSPYHLSASARANQRACFPGYVAITCTARRCTNQSSNRARTNALLWPHLLHHAGRRCGAEGNYSCEVVSRSGGAVPAFRTSKPQFQLEGPRWLHGVNRHRPGLACGARYKECVGIRRREVCNRPSLACHCLCASTPVYAELARPHPVGQRSAVAMPTPDLRSCPSYYRPQK